MALSPAMVHEFSLELQKLAGAIQPPEPELKTRFKAITNILHEHGVFVDTSHKRIIVPKDMLTTEDLYNLGFQPSLIAIPEEGQESPVSFRNPKNLYHLHPHGSVWTMHKDAVSATTGNAKATLKHLMSDGLPAVGSYIKERLLGTEGSLAEKVRLALPQDFFEKMQALRADS